MNEQIKLFNMPDATPWFRVTDFVWHVLSVIQMLLVMRFILKILHANPQGGFTDLIYNITNYILYPVAAIPGSSASNVFEWKTLLAIIAYWVLAIVVIELLNISQSPYSRAKQARALSRKKYSHNKARVLY